MDVDAPNILKRCSSAPLINEAVSTAATSPTTHSAPRNSSLFNMFSNNVPQRTRRFSFSFSPLASPVTTTNSCGPRLTHRVNQLRAEECLEAGTTRELAHEREVHSAMQMGQSCEDLTLAALPHSPTRIPRFSPVVSPSPTRKYTTRRSLSPIAIRASCFSPTARACPKRRGDDPGLPPAKRARTPATPPTPDSDSLDYTFRPVSPRPQPMNQSPDSLDTHKSTNTS